MLISIIGALLFLIMLVLTILIIAGLPLGEFVMGGRHKLMPRRMIPMCIVTALVQASAIFIILQAGGVLPLWLPTGAVTGMCYFFAVYLSLNTVMNLFSNSKKEKIFATPLALIAAVCFWITAIS